MTLDEANKILNGKGDFYLSETQNGYVLTKTTNGGFGHAIISKDNNENFIYYSYVPNGWDMDTGRVYGYHEYEISYMNINDLISSKNGKTLIDKITYK